MVLLAQGLPEGASWGQLCWGLLVVHAWVLPEPAGAASVLADDHQQLCRLQRDCVQLLLSCHSWCPLLPHRKGVGPAAEWLPHRKVVGEEQPTTHMTAVGCQ